jgi:coenzyme F420-0:L-glutamate ligase/coenzyme F420-1:gamma-L-glutamate ligase
LLTVYPIGGLPEISPGTNLAPLLVTAVRGMGMTLAPDDIMVVTQKVVSKAEGQLCDLRSVTPSPRAVELAAKTQFEARHVEVILRESVRIVRAAARVLITETRHGFVCANAGVDRSNTGGRELAVLLPRDPDRSAASIRADVQRITGVSVGVLISDSFGRPWREGQVNVAIGAAGISVLRDYRGENDPEGYQLQGSVLGVGDELAGLAELVMGKLDRVPAALVRGAQLSGEGTARPLLRDPSTDLFR